MRVMLDTNILVSAFIFKSSIMNKLIYSLSKNNKIVICSYTINELKDLMTEKFKISQKYLEMFLKEFPFELVASPENINYNLFSIRDPNDYIILYTAIISNIDIFITGDKDFQELHILKPKIMSASEFLEQYGSI